MRLWRWLRAFLSNQTTLALLVVDLEARAERLTRALRQAEVRRVAEVSELHERVAELRREAQSLDAANHEVIAQNRRERLFGNQLAHRNRLAHDWARQHLPREQADQVCALLAPKLADPQEAPHAHV